MTGLYGDPLPEYRHLHPSHRVDVGSASSLGLVVVHGGYDGGEGLPVEAFLRFCEFVPVFGYVLVGFSEHIRSKRVYKTANQY